MELFQLNEQVRTSSCAVESTSGKHRYCYQPITEFTPLHWQKDQQGDLGNTFSIASSSVIRRATSDLIGRRRGGRGRAITTCTHGHQPRGPTCNTFRRVRNSVRAQLCEGARRLPAWIDKGKVLKRSLHETERAVLGCGGYAVVHSGSMIVLQTYAEKFSSSAGPATQPRNGRLIPGSGWIKPSLPSALSVPSI